MTECNTSTFVTKRMPVFLLVTAQSSVCTANMSTAQPTTRQSNAIAREGLAMNKKKRHDGEVAEQQITLLTVHHGGFAGDFLL